MGRWVARMRGVNVGGVKIAMADLRALAAGLGWRDPQTYVAGGNLTFAADGAEGPLAANLEAALEAHLVRAVPTLVLGANRIRRVLAGCPFDPVKGAARDGVVWLHAPDGVGRSALAAKMEKVVTGTRMTARNLATIRALVRILDADGAA